MFITQRGKVHRIFCTACKTVINVKFIFWISAQHFLYFTNCLYTLWKVTDTELCSSYFRFWEKRSLFKNRMVKYASLLLFLNRLSKVAHPEIRSNTIFSFLVDNIKVVYFTLRFSWNLYWTRKLFETLKLINIF